LPTRFSSEGRYVAEIEARKSAGGDCNSEGAIGRYGALRTTHRSNGFTGETRYFEKGGKLIAVRADTDVFLGKDAYPNWTHYGAAITCPVTNVKRLCKPDRRLESGSELQKRRRPTFYLEHTTSVASASDGRM